MSDEYKQKIGIPDDHTLSLSLLTGKELEKVRIPMNTFTVSWTLREM